MTTPQLTEGERLSIALIQARIRDQETLLAFLLSSYGVQPRPGLVYNIAFETLADLSRAVFDQKNPATRERQLPQEVLVNPLDVFTARQPNLARPGVKLMIGVGVRRFDSTSRPDPAPFFAITLVRY
jgi:hypothetical protein